MKKILCIFSALLIVLGAAFFGCGKKNDKAAAEQSETAAPTTESTTAPDPKPVLSGDAALNDGETYTGRLRCRLSILTFPIPKTHAAFRPKSTATATA